jgi:hypothetical protein
MLQKVDIVSLNANVAVAMNVNGFYVVPAHAPHPPPPAATLKPRHPQRVVLVFALKPVVLLRAALDKILGQKSIGH